MFALTKNGFAQKLEQYKQAKNIFIFLHITPVKWTSGAVDCPEFQQLLLKYPNVRAVFNGHDHEQDSIKLLENKIPFMFDGHIGGSWGTYYKGFRVVELKEDNSLVTYLMDPLQKKNQATF
ncbi:metallophosphoesterase family protein [Rufibacter immobilis]|uniref:metallophosphoesterase family protein n=1 Tax=Rufibacter immobilis TaxID=1348778 RepID=UPI0035E91BBC